MDSRGLTMATSCMVLYILTVVVWLKTNHVQGAPKLLFTTRHDIRVINVDEDRNTSTVLLPDLDNVASVDFIHSQNLIFWTDVTLEVINMVYINNPQNRTTVISTGLLSADGIACDWIAMKLYWTDSQRKLIEVSNLDGTIRKVLFWEDLDKPRAIALDPAFGYMYWTDWGENPAIERASMDGSQREKIITDNIHWPNGLTLDFEISRLYWTDAKLGFIHRCDFDGSNRQQVIAGLKHPYALTWYDESVYWTDWKTKSIHRCDKWTGEETETVLTSVSRPADVRVLAASRQRTGPNAHACGSNNGGCSHLCLISSSEAFYTCPCPTGVVLKADNKTCQDGPQKFLLMSRRKTLRYISLDTTDYTDVTVPLSNITNVIAIDYDPIEGYVYWVDLTVQVIGRAHLNGTGEEVVIGKDLKNPDGLAVEWVNRKLYWTDTGMDRIEVAGLDGADRQVIISEQLDKPRAIKVDPTEGYIYWTDWGANPRIERVKMDGTDRSVLINSSLGWPNGLALDLRTRYMYWGDAKTDQIEMATLEGKNRTRRSIQRVNTADGKDRITIKDQLPDIMGLKAVDINSFEVAMKASTITTEVTEGYSTEVTTEASSTTMEGYSTEDSSRGDKITEPTEQNTRIPGTDVSSTTFENITLSRSTTSNMHCERDDTLTEPTENSTFSPTTASTSSASTSGGNMTNTVRCDKCTIKATQASKGNSLVDIEREKLDVMKQMLAVMQRRLVLKKKRRP